MDGDPRQAQDVLPPSVKCPTCRAASTFAGVLRRCLNGHEFWAPNPGPQTKFLASKVHEILYGGAAGGGKSASLIAYPLRWVENQNFKGLVLRRETTQLGELIELSKKLYTIPGIDGRSAQTGSGIVWRFPGGAQIRFGHCKDEKDAADYDGWEFQFIAFDELTHFTEKQYKSIKARCRGTDVSLPKYLRSSTNPGGDGHEWVFHRWGAWLNPEFTAPGLKQRPGRPPLDPGQVAYITLDGNVECYVARGTSGALSRTFIPAQLADNPALAQGDPNYWRNLQDLDPVRRAQLSEGNWLARPGEGKYFKQEWVKIVDAVPSEVVARVRAWDVAATESGGDWTVGVRMSLTSDGLVWIEDVRRFRGRPRQVNESIRGVAEYLDSKDVKIGLPQDPGQAGVAQCEDWAKMLSGFTFKFIRPSGDKITRFGPFSSQAEAKNVRVLRADWNKEYFGELEAFPEGTYDDQVDATSDAFIILNRPKLPRGNIEVPWTTL